METAASRTPAGANETVHRQPREWVSKPSIPKVPCSPALESSQDYLESTLRDSKCLGKLTQGKCRPFLDMEWKHKGIAKNNY